MLHIEFDATSARLGALLAAGFRKNAARSEAELATARAVNDGSRKSLAEIRRCEDASAYWLGCAARAQKAADEYFAGMKKAA